MKVATINIRSVKIHTPEPPRPSTDGDGGERATAATMTTTGDTTVTDPVSVQVFEAPAPDPLNDEAFTVVVAQPMDKTPGRPISPLTEDGGSVVGGVLAHVMDASTVGMPPPPPFPLLLPLPQIIPVPLPPSPLLIIPAPRTPSPQRRSPGERPTTRSHSTGEKADFHGRKWFEDHYGVKQNINGPHPFRQWFLRNTIGSKLTPGCEEGKTFSCLDYLLLLFPPNQFKWMTLYTSQQLIKNGEKRTTKGEMMKWFGIIILATRIEFGDRASLWSTVSQSEYISAPDFGNTGMNRQCLLLKNCGSTDSALLALSRRQRRNL